jgi:hypothetical protein
MQTDRNTDRIFWAQNPNSALYNDGEYKLRLLNGKAVGIGDEVLVKFINGNFRGKIKQVAGFGLHEHRDVVSVLFPGKSKGKKVHIDSVLDKM